MVGVWEAAIYGTNSGALRLLMKAGAFRAFTGDDVIILLREGGMRRVRIYGNPISEGNRTIELRPLPVSPLNTPLIDGVIGALWLAGTAVDAVIGDANGHI
jgi:hypothetical protein